MLQLTKILHHLALPACAAIQCLAHQCVSPHPLVRKFPDSRPSSPRFAIVASARKSSRLVRAMCRAGLETWGSLHQPAETERKAARDARRTTNKDLLWTPFCKPSGTTGAEGGLQGCSCGSRICKAAGETCQTTSTRAEACGGPGGATGTRTALRRLPVGRLRRGRRERR